MIEVKPKFNIIADDSVASTRFSIKEENLAHIFDVLRNNVYSDKMLAIIREYSTNAIDANVEAGKEKTPIHITLPTIVESTFKVRDNGLGLSEEEIFEVYSSYGASTKRDSNKLIGAKGLGSKSAFAYSSSFSIASYHGGYKKIYEAYIDESNLGTIAKTHEEKSNEPTGIEISIAINNSDISTFNDKAMRFYAFVNPFPVVTGYNETLKEWKAKSLNKVGAADGYEIYTLVDRWSSRYSWSSGVGVRMGNTVYFIPTDVLSKPEISLNYISQNHKVLILDAEIGAFPVTASREELEYTPATIAKLSSMAKKWKKLYGVKVNNKLSKCETPWLAYANYNKLDSFERGCVINIDWNGIKLDPNNVDRNGLDACKKNQYNGRWETSYNCWGSICTTDYPIIILNDGGFPAYQLKGRLDDAKNKAETMIADKTTKQTSYCYLRGDVGQTKNFLGIKEIEGVVTILLSDMADINPRNKKKALAGRVFKFNGELEYPYSNCWDETQIDSSKDTKKRVYIIIDKYIPQNIKYTFGLNSYYNRGKDEYKPIDFMNKGISLINSFEGSTLEVYGIKDEKYKGKNWINFNDYIEELIASVTADQNVIKQLCVNTLSGWIGKDNRISWEIVKESFDAVDDCDIINRIKSHTTNNNLPNVSSKVEFVNKIGADFSDEIKKWTNGLDKMTVEYLNKYPVLEFFGSNRYGQKSHIPALTNYIKLVNKCG
jgi:hypothetical protein